MNQINNAIGVGAAIFACVFFNSLGFHPWPDEEASLGVIGAIGIPIAILSGYWCWKAIMQAPQDWLRPVRIAGHGATAGWVGMSVLAAFTVNPSVVLSGAIVAAIILAVYYKITNSVSSSSVEGEHIRGARLVDADEVAALVKKEKLPYDLTIGSVPFPRKLESSMTLIVGMTGSGKTVTFFEILDSVARRGDRMIVADQNANFMRRYYADGDIILNPLDKRSANWSPFAEIKKFEEIAAMAKTFAPDGESSEEEVWQGFARSFIAGVLEACIDQNKATNEYLRYYIFRAPIEELQVFLADTDAIALVTGDNARAFGSSRMTAIKRFEFFKYLNPAAGVDAFSVSDWIRNGNPGRIFMNYKDDQIDVLRPMIATILDIFSRTVTSLPENRENRIWLVADECDSLGKIGTLKDFLTKARKAGGCALLGIQSVAQFRQTYGQHTAMTMLGNLNNWVVMRVKEPETTKYMSQLLGDHKFKQRVESGGESKGETSSRNENWSDQIAKDPIVMASEFGTLPDCTGYLWMGDYPVCPVAMPFPIEYEDSAVPFDLRDINAERAAAKAKAAAEAKATPAEAAAPAAPAKTKAKAKAKAKAEAVDESTVDVVDEVTDEPPADTVDPETGEIKYFNPFDTN